MTHAAELRRCLEACDVAALRRLWAHVSPHLPQPNDDASALVALHHARTQANSIALRLRAWSHRWLVDHGFPSGLPDELRPRAERMYPRIVDGVGIAVGTLSSTFKPIVPLIRTAMEHAVLDAYADNRKDPAFVQARMFEARDRAVKQLVGV